MNINNIKTLKFLFVIITFGLSFISCKEDEPVEPQPQSIIGTWFGPGHWEDTWTYTFRTDGTCTQIYTNDDEWNTYNVEDGTYTISKNIITMEYEHKYGCSTIIEAAFSLGRDNKGEYLRLFPFKLYKIE